MIRNFNKQDIDEIMNIWLKTNKKVHNFILDKEYFDRNFNFVKEEILKAKVYVYEKEKEIVGFIGLVQNYIAGIFVKENMQHKGIGKALLNRCKKEYDKLTLNVYEKNKMAISFYEKEGFYILKRKLDEQVKEVELFMEWSKYKGDINE